MRTYLYALVILAVVLVAHIIGIGGSYVTMPGYDVVMHLLGGCGIGLFAAALLGTYGSRIVHRRRAIILAVLAAGIFWELFEIIYDIAGYPLWTKLYYLDTLKDLAMDTLGGAAIAYICTPKRSEK